MLGVEDEVHIQQAGGFLVGGLAEHHIQEVAGVAEVGVGSEWLQPLPQPVMRRHDGRPLRREADALADGGFNRVVGNLGHIKPGQRRNAGAQSVHGVGVLHHLQHRNYAIGDAPTGAKLGVKVRQLLRAGQAAV